MMPLTTTPSGDMFNPSAMGVEFMVEPVCQEFEKKPIVLIFLYIFAEEEIIITLIFI